MIEFTTFLIYFILGILSLVYIIFSIIGAIKLCRGKKYVLFVLGFFISLIWFIASFFKIKER